MTLNKLINLKVGRTLAYIEYGDPKGKALFYFHGWPASRYSGAETDAAAKRLHVRIISLDRPGFGLSEFNEGRTLLDWAEDVTEVADQLKLKKFAVMGVSGGGPYAAACAYKIPKRITKAGIVVGLAPTNIRGILHGMSLIGKIGWTSYRRFPAVRTLAAIGAMIQYKYFPFIGWQMGFRAREDRAVIRGMKKSDLYQRTKEAFRQGWRGADWDLKLYTDDWGFNLNDIMEKVFLWYGSKDNNVPLVMGKYYHSQIPGSKLFIDHHGGHLSRYLLEEKIIQALTL